MVSKLIDIDLLLDLWEKKTTSLNLIKKSDAEILSNIIRNHLAEHGFHPNIYSLTHGNEVKDYLETHETMIMSIVELLEEKGLATYHDWAKIMAQKTMKE